MVYRLGCAIPVPFVSGSALTQMFANGDMLSYLNMMSGGALARCTLFALGVTPMRKNWTECAGPTPLSAAALKYGGEHIEAGMTTWELDKIIYDFIIKHGGTPNFKGLYGFPGTACISLNDTIIHGIPSHDIVIRPVTSSASTPAPRSTASTATMPAPMRWAKVDLEAQRLMDVTKAALYKGIEQAIAGNRIGDIGQAVQTYCEDAGFSVVREFVGHGTGRELHEDPEVPNYGHQAAARVWCPA